MTFEEKVKQWKLLKKSKKALEKRVKDLRQDIVDNFPLNNDIAAREGITLQERNKTTYDESNVWMLMEDRGIPVEDFTQRVIDESRLEELYYEGKLTDSDLRQIRTPQYIYALVETEVEDVQGQADDIC